MLAEKHTFWKQLRLLVSSNWPAIAIVAIVFIVVANSLVQSANAHHYAGGDVVAEDSLWLAPTLYRDSKTSGKQREMIMYGQDLIANTAKYLGPKGTVLQTTNGMNCQNCHLDAGTRAWGNNYGAVASTYPKFRARSGTTEGIAKRVNDCIERSLNGTALDTTSYEMKCIIVYMKWLGQQVPKGQKPQGTGIAKVPYLQRAANPLAGRQVYIARCARCHNSDGSGLLNMQANAYTYPPLWGPHSYNTGAGLYRLSSFAGFVQNNMPFGEATYTNKVLSDTEAWDVAAYVNSQQRPVADISRDWPAVKAKPFDHPFGPYADAFSEQQHKYGPFLPIIAQKQATEKKE